jgi:hypothetical protein
MCCINWWWTNQICNASWWNTGFFCNMLLSKFCCFHFIRKVDYDGPVIQVPQGKWMREVHHPPKGFAKCQTCMTYPFCSTGSQLELSEDTVQGVLAACREEIGYVQYLVTCSLIYTIV